MKVVKLNLIRFIVCFIAVFLMRFFISNETIVLSLIFSAVFTLGLYVLLRVYNSIVDKRTKMKKAV